MRARQEHHRSSNVAGVTNRFSRADVRVTSPNKFLGSLAVRKKKLTPPAVAKLKSLTKNAKKSDAISYQKPFLTQAIVRVDFVAPIDGLQKSMPTKLGKIISDRFPIVEPSQTIAQQFQFGGAKVKREEHRFTQWNFYGKGREKQLTIAPSFFFVSYTRYTRYEDLKSDFAAALNCVSALFPDATVSRLGLRYINNIEIDGLFPVTKWKSYISPDLLGMNAFASRTDHITRLFHSVELKYDDLQIRFQFGMPNPDYPAIIKRPLFVLDFDGYVQAAHGPTQSLQYMDDAHRHIQDLFELSITRKLRERMRGK